MENEMLPDWPGMERLPGGSGKYGASTSTPGCPLAWQRAFALAGAHGHLWAHPVSEEVVAARAAVETERARHLTRWPDDADRQARASLAAAFEEAVRDLRERGDGRAPRSEAEARVAEHAACVDNMFPSGIGPSLFHATGTGRLTWRIDPATGSVAIAVSRPDGDVLRAVVAPDGSVFAGPVPAGQWGGLRPYGWRHVEALRHALRALGVELPVACALGADDVAAVAAGFESRAAEADALATEVPDEPAYRLDAECARERAAAFRAWERLRRPVIRGGTAAAYEAAAADIATEQRRLLTVMFGGAL